MQPQIEQRSLTVRGAVQVATFGAREQDTPHLFRILRSTLYSNKPRAVLREYFSNAWDAHQQIGIPDRAVRVNLPTVLDSMLRIRDYGPGMSEETVRSTYAMYGASTKRGDNQAVGYLGIGSKSAFCYTDSFTVTSWHGGSKSVYQAVLGESDQGDILLLHREACDPAETGIEISMAVREADIRQFHVEAADLFQWAVPRPIINIDLPDTPPETSPYGTLLPVVSTTQYGDWTLVMGCIPYPLDVGLVGAGLPPVLNNKFRMHRGILRVPIGAVSVAASRENLEYTDRTRASIDTYLRLLYESVRSHAEAVCQEDSAATDWQRRLMAWRVVRDTAWEPPPHVVPWAKHEVDLKDHIPEHFSVYKPHHSRRGAVLTTKVTEIAVHPEARLVILPVKRRPLQFYDLNPHTDWLVECPRSVDDPTAAVQAMAAAARITGIEIAHAQIRPQTTQQPTASRPRIAATDCRYELRNHWDGAKPRNSWDLIGGEPADTDVYMDLVAFRPDGLIMEECLNEMRILRLMGVDSPPIIGYRRTSKFPDVVPGTPFRKWRNQAFHHAVNTCPPDQARFLRWRQTIGHSRSRIYINWGSVWSHVEAQIGKDHPFASALQDMELFCKNLHARGPYSTWVSDLTWVTFHFGASIPHPLQALMGRYPLICSYNLEPILEKPSLLQEWLGYINLVDKSTDLPQE